MLFKKKKKKYEDVNLMDLIPDRLLDFRVEEDTGFITLLIPKFRGKISGKLIQPKLPEEKAFFRAKLDKFGTFVWDHIDGNRTVYDIYRAFEKEFDDQDKVLDRLVMFVQHLEQNKFIKFKNLPSA